MSTGPAVRFIIWTFSFYHHILDFQSIIKLQSIIKDGFGGSTRSSPQGKPAASPQVVFEDVIPLKLEESKQNSQLPYT